MQKTKSIFAGLIILAAKLGGKALPVLAKILGKATSVKALLAAASFGAYSFLFSWKFALLIMLALGIHESGHVWAMKRCGIKTKGFYFIPFVGGAAVSDEAFPSREAESFVALMGPVWGFATAIIPVAVYLTTNNPMYASIAAWVSAINIFNLLPINPLDGGRVAKCIAFSFNSAAGYICLAIGMVLAISLLSYLGIGLLVLMFVVGGIEILGEYLARKTHKKDIELYNLRIKETDKFEELVRNAGLEDKFKVMIEHRSLYSNFSLEKRYLERCKEKIDKDAKRFVGMSRKNVWLSLLGYAALIGLFSLFVISLGHIPGADLALSFLKD